MQQQAIDAGEYQSPVGLGWGQKQPLRELVTTAGDWPAGCMVARLCTDNRPSMYSDGRRG